MDKIYLDQIEKDSNPEIWKEEINAIKKRYGSNLPQNKVIFTGSSTIRRWSSLKEDMNPIEVLNHGFGGSGLYDSIYYANAIVYPFNPRAVIIYAGSNDITGFEDTKPAKEAFSLVKKLLLDYRKRMPKTQLYYISINLCNNRTNAFEESLRFNEMIEELIESEEHMTYIQTWDMFLNKDGLPDDNFFVEDKLHLNEKGYLLLKNKVRSILLKDLD